MKSTPAPREVMPHWPFDAAEASVTGQDASRQSSAEDWPCSPGPAIRYCEFGALRVGTATQAVVTLIVGPGV